MTRNGIPLFGGVEVVTTAVTQALPSQLRSRFAALQRPDGGFGATEGIASDSESTAYAVLAARDSAPRAVEWLLGQGLPSGAFALSGSAKNESWATAPALLALANGTGEPREVLQRGAAWLCAARGRELGWIARFLQLMTPKAQRVDQDASLVGWSWHRSAQSWVEPTALAILALKKLRTRTATPQAEERIREGEALIVDRMCPGGGWNYGNKRVLDFQLEPFADVTGFALLALDLGQRDAISQSLARLDALLEHERSGLALSLAVLAFQRHGFRHERWRGELERWAANPPHRLETRTGALALLAIEENLGALVS